MTAGGTKKMCISNLYFMKPLNLRLRLWNRSCVVTSHFEVQYNIYKLGCLHVFFFFFLSRYKRRRRIRSSSLR